MYLSWITKEVQKQTETRKCCLSTDLHFGLNELICTFRAIADYSKTRTKEILNQIETKRPKANKM